MSWRNYVWSEITSDPHVSGKHGFELHDSRDEQLQCIAEMGPFFESGLVFSTREDAQRAADAAGEACARFWKSLR